MYGNVSRGWMDHDLSMAQVRVMMFLSEHRPCAVSELAMGLGIGRPAASMLVDRVVHAGYATREEDQEDRRRAVVSLSPGGHSLIEKLREGEQDHFLALLERLDDNDLMALANGLGALANAARENPPHPDPPEVLPSARPPLHIINPA